MARVRRHANTGTRPVIPKPPQGDRSAPQGSRYLMFPRTTLAPASPGKSLMNPDVRRPAGPDMPEIVECVLNFSEGRPNEVVDAIAHELQVPVYLYEAAATRPDRRSLPEVRRGEYEGLKKEIETNPDRKPDFGPPRLHPTAGACIVGARPVLIAWNVNLRTTDVGVAKRIAKAIRESDGGLPAVRAKGFDLADRGLVQVSMNMVDYRKTSLAQAFEAIRALAAKESVEIAESEIIGLMPLDALVDAATQYLKLARFHREQILETRLWE